MATVSENESTKPLNDKRVAFVGKLGGVNRREAARLVRELGGTAVDKPEDAADLVVIGADEWPIGETETSLDETVRLAAAEGRLEVITETQFWQRLGLVENEQNVRRLYTPAMLADLLDVSVAVIRRWHRRGLIVPAREVRKLPYFDFQEVATARRLAQLVASGASPTVIEKKLEQLSRLVPDVERPLAQLTVIVEGKQILLRQGEGLIEPGGQLRFDFEALDQRSQETQREIIPTPPRIVSFEDEQPDPDPTTPEEICRFAAELEDQGRLDDAVELYRAALAAARPNAEVCFQLAELLYRQCDLPAARERYYMAIELDEEFVEARANLGCVLAESGELDLAVAAFEGALLFHSDYPDVHYHLARALEELGRGDHAREHWGAFLDLAPDSPWAQEARDRLHLVVE